MMQPRGDGLSPLYAATPHAREQNDSLMVAGFNMIDPQVRHGRGLGARFNMEVIVMDAATARNISDAYNEAWHFLARLISV